MILIIDNYDSFTYNLVQYFGILGVEMRVFRNDAVTKEEIEQLSPSAIVISPGPCTPKEAGISVPVIQKFHKKIPILGVCLGHQAIGEAFGGKVVRAKEIVHGKMGSIHHDGSAMYEGLPDPFTATRYHSLIIERETMPEELIVSAWLEDGTVMGIRHRKYPVFGLQFHPESIATENGIRLLKNFLENK